MLVFFTPNDADSFNKHFLVLDLATSLSSAKMNSWIWIDDIFDDVDDRLNVYEDDYRVNVYGDFGDLMFQCLFGSL